MSRTAPDRTFVLAGIDQDVRNVGGRDGAREGPARLLEGLEDRGLVQASDRTVTVEVENTAASLEEDLDRLSSAVETALGNDRLPVVLGGGHGTTYATVRGASRVLTSPGVAYLDVHLDVRDYHPQHTSGSSFRRLIEENHVPADRVRPVGIQTPESPESSDFVELEAWALEHGIRYAGLQQVREAPERALADVLDESGDWCLSLDVDVLSRRYAPGVSAPGEDRLSLHEAVSAVEAARGGFEVLDIAEYSPRLDEKDRTVASALDLLEAALGEP